MPSVVAANAPHSSLAAIARCGILHARAEKPTAALLEWRAAPETKGRSPAACGWSTCGGEIQGETAAFARPSPTADGRRAPVWPRLSIAFSRRTKVASWDERPVCVAERGRAHADDVRFTPRVRRRSLMTQRLDGGLDARLSAPESSQRRFRRMSRTAGPRRGSLRHPRQWRSLTNRCSAISVNA
jgi:hypothetical protein